MNAQVRPLYCDGCGLPAISSHLRRRYERIEFATKYRPIHIQVLLLNDAPPPLIEDFFYRPGSAEGERSGYHRIFFQELMGARAVFPWTKWSLEEEALAEFQRRGFFLADICECPLEEFASAAGDHSKTFVRPAHIRKFAPTVVKRIQHSYKPKKIVLIGADSAEVIPALEQAGMAGQLVLENGRPIFDPSFGDPAGSAEFATSLAGRIERALASVR